MRLTISLFLALTATPAAAQQAHDLVLADLGRWAVFADLESVVRDGETAEMRALQVAEEGFHVGEVAYWGGWSRWRFDCSARTADRLDFASVREGGDEAAAWPDAAPPYDAAPGGEAAALLDRACARPRWAEDGVDSVAEAVRLGRHALEGGQGPGDSPD